MDMWNVLIETCLLPAESKVWSALSNALYSFFAAFCKEWGGLSGNPFGLGGHPLMKYEYNAVHSFFAAF